ncbi:VOC family protein [Chachezhania sediminis]|uniref:VOC family protein n=1 Tax=Chachezhania sediminis TaxID=2599291 RepID=UPI00131D0F29|nr:VOC family protein [Chachezhania sediminis]
MGKLRHVAIQVPDLEKAAAFYENVFELKRVGSAESPIGNAISLSDGVVNLTLLHFPEGTVGGKGGPDWAGLHHIGFVVDDEEAADARIKENGGAFFMQLTPYPGVDAEKKYKDVNGIVFDMAAHNWIQADAAE